MSHQWVNFCGQVIRLSRSASVKRVFFTLLLLSGACLLFVLPVLHLPFDVAAVHVADTKLTNHEEKPIDKVQQVGDYSWMKQPRSPVPAICTGPDSTCLEALFLLAPGEQNRKLKQYEIPAIVHMLSTEPNNQDPSSVGAFLLEWRRLHRNWTYVLWTKGEVTQLVRQLYRRYLPLLQERPALLPLLAPFLIVQKYGGVMVTSNHRPTRNIDSLRLLPAVFSADVQRWPQFSADAGLFMSAPGHPFMQYCIDLALMQPADFAQANLTHLLIKYDAAFPVTERARHSIHLAQLVAPKTAGFEITVGARIRLDSAETSQRSSKLRYLLGKCEQPTSGESDQGRFIRNRSLGIGCSTLGELFSLLSNRGGTFVTAAVPTPGRASPDRQLKKPGNLASTFPMLNVGLQKA